MVGLVCCCEARKLTKLIAWIQIIMFLLGLLLAGGSLIAFLAAGQDAVDQVSEEHPYHENTSSTEWNLAYSSDYVKLVFVLTVCLVVLLIGIILAVFLIKGANESKSRYLKWWVVFAVLCLVWAVVAAVLSADSALTLVLRISVSCFLYGFCISVVVTLIREIERDKREKEEPRGGHRDSRQTLGNPPPFPTKV